MTAARLKAHPLSLALACALSLILSLVPAPALAEQRPTDFVLGETAASRGIDTAELPDINCANAIVVSEDGTVYFERDADEPVKIASITKIMTAIVALENSQLTDIVTVDNAAATVGESTAGLQEGDTLSMESALRGLLIPSGNDAAIAIATTVGRTLDPNTTDPVATFVAAMNSKAAELGCADTLFSNPHGLDFDTWAADMHSTARDVATMYAYAMRNDAFRAIVNSPATDLTITGADGTVRQQPQTMHNVLLGQQGNIGGKTGTTDDAGFCFVAGYSQETGGEIYTVVLGAPSDEERFADTVALASWYYGHIAQVPLVNTARSLGDTPLAGRAPLADWSDRSVAVTFTDPAQTVEVFSLAGELEQQADYTDLSGDVEAGQDAGELVYLQDGEEVATAQLVCAESQQAPNPLEWLMVHFDRLIRAIQGKPGTAEPQVYNEAPDPLAYDSFDAA